MEEHKAIFWLYAGVLILLILPSEARLPQKWDFWYKGFFPECARASSKGTDSENEEWDS